MSFCCANKLILARGSCVIIDVISENEVRRLLFPECILHTRTFSHQFDLVLVLDLSPVGNNHCHNFHFIDKKLKSEREKFSLYI